MKCSMLLPIRGQGLKIRVREGESRSQQVGVSEGNHRDTTPNRPGSRKFEGKFIPEQGSIHNFAKKQTLACNLGNQ